MFLSYDAREKKGVFDNTYYVQLMLKGMGSVGTSGASGMLTSRIAGFHDNFAAGALR